MTEVPCQQGRTLWWCVIITQWVRSSSSPSENHSPQSLWCRLRTYLFLPHTTGARESGARICVRNEVRNKSIGRYLPETIYLEILGLVLGYPWFWIVHKKVRKFYKMSRYIYRCMSFRRELRDVTQLKLFLLRICQMVYMIFYRSKMRTETLHAQTFC